MNILVFSWRDPKHPTAGGAEQVMHEHMKGWVSAGHKVTLFSSRVVGLPDEETIDKVKIIRRGIQYFGVQIEGLLYYLKNKNRFDLVVDQFHGLPFFTPFYVKQPKLAVIQEIAGKVWLKNEFPFPFNIIVGMVGYLGEPFLFIIYKHIDFMTGSNSAKESLIKVGIPSKNIHIIPHGVIIENPNPFPQKEETKTIMFLGAISKDKGINEVLATFEILNSLGDYQFWIVGRANKEYTNYINSFVKKNNLNEKFHYFGFVSQKEKFKILAKAHVLINPSLVEGWGLVNIEANAMGTPVVAYNSPGLIDSIKNGVTGIIVDENKPEKLADAADRLMKNNKKYQNLMRGAIKWSKNFNWKKSKKMSLALIEEIV